jgi:hypothetical protein
MKWPQHCETLLPHGMPKFTGNGNNDEDDVSRWPDNVAM